MDAASRGRVVRHPVDGWAVRCTHCRDAPRRAACSCCPCSGGSAGDPCHLGTPQGAAPTLCPGPPLLSTHTRRRQRGRGAAQLHLQDQTARRRGSGGAQQHAPRLGALAAAGAGAGRPAHHGARALARQQAARMQAVRMAAGPLAAPTATAIAAACAGQGRTAMHRALTPAAPAHQPRPTALALSGRALAAPPPGRHTTVCRRRRRSGRPTWRPACWSTARPPSWRR
jgi:hypothetical protein